jgi:hypothetical protein
MIAEMGNMDKEMVRQILHDQLNMNMHWKTPTSPRMKKARMSKSKVKAMMIVFFEIRGVLMIEWVPEVQMVNQKWRTC